MFRYRQTQQLQRDLEARFGELLKPFGLSAQDKERPAAQRPIKKDKRRADARKPHEGFRRTTQ